MDWRELGISAVVGVGIELVVMLGVPVVESSPPIVLGDDETLPLAVEKDSEGGV